MDLGKQLLNAAREGHIDQVRHLVVESGAPFTSDWLGTTALHLASQYGHVEITEILLKAGVNRDAKTKLNRTALHLAAQSGSLEIVDMLLNHGCDVNARDMLKMTPLHWAIDREHVFVARRLLLHGADVTVRSKFLLTPIEIARSSSCVDIVDLFRNIPIRYELASNLYGNLAQSTNTTSNNRMAKIKIQPNTCSTMNQDVKPNNSNNYINIITNNNHNINSNTNTNLNIVVNNEIHDNITNIIANSNNCTNVSSNSNSNSSSFTSNQANSSLGSIGLTNIVNNSTTVTTSHSNNNNNNINNTLGSERINVINPSNHNLANNTIVESHDLLDYYLSLDNCISAARSTVLDIDEPSVDLVELEWNALNFEPEFFLSNDDDDEEDEDLDDLDDDARSDEDEDDDDEDDDHDTDEGEPKVEYLLKIVEELQKENSQLRQKVEQLSPDNR